MAVAAARPELASRGAGGSLHTEGMTGWELKGFLICAVWHRPMAVRN